MMNIVLLESFKVDIKKTGKENVYIIPRHLILFSRKERIDLLM